MQSTGQISTQALSFTPTHGSQMIYAIPIRSPSGTHPGLCAARTPKIRSARSIVSPLGRRGPGSTRYRDHLAAHDGDEEAPPPVAEAGAVVFAALALP